MKKKKVSDFGSCILDVREEREDVCDSSRVSQTLNASLPIHCKDTTQTPKGAFEQTVLDVRLPISTKSPQSPQSADVDCLIERNHFLIDIPSERTPKAEGPDDEGEGDLPVEKEPKSGYQFSSQSKPPPLRICVAKVMEALRKRGIEAVSVHEIWETLIKMPRFKKLARNSVSAIFSNENERAEGDRLFTKVGSCSSFSRATSLHALKKGLDLQKAEAFVRKLNSPASSASLSTKRKQRERDSPMEERAQSASSADDTRFCDFNLGEHEYFRRATLREVIVATMRDLRDNQGIQAIGVYDLWLQIQKIPGFEHTRRDHVSVIFTTDKKQTKRTPLFASVGKARRYGTGVQVPGGMAATLHALREGMKVQNVREYLAKFGDLSEEENDLDELEEEEGTDEEAGPEETTLPDTEIDWPAALAKIMTFLAQDKRIYVISPSELLSQSVNFWPFVMGKQRSIQDLTKDLETDQQRFVKFAVQNRGPMFALRETPSSSVMSYLDKFPIWEQLLESSKDLPGKAPFLVDLTQDMENSTRELSPSSSASSSSSPASSRAKISFLLN